jgi:hypothetical protein
MLEPVRNGIAKTRVGEKITGKPTRLFMIRTPPWETPTESMAGRKLRRVHFAISRIIR